MGNKDFSNSENIHIKVDENNLFYIDPNTIVVDGKIQPRLVKHENLVMYVNLEADIIPRSRLSIGDSSTITSIANGSFNMLRSQTSGDNKELTSDWTESYTPKNDKLNINDGTGQSFGMTNINIIVKGANFIPQIDITFVDVRGKTLFESPENSPYKAFFQMPWPIFYLTVKGYYGKAIRYRLHLVKLNTSYVSSNGNFETSAKFVGSTFAFMNDIPLKGILNAPYMFGKKTTGPQKVNEETGVIDVKVFKSSKGYSVLRSVYDEMKAKKYIPQDFPVITLRELGHIAGRLDVILEKKIFDEVADPKLISAFKEYGEIIQITKKGVNAWRQQNIENTNPTKINNEDYYGLKNPSTEVTGKTTNGTLEIFLAKFNTEQEIIVDTYNRLAAENKELNTKLLVNKLKPITDYYVELPKKMVAIYKLLQDIDEIEKIYIEQDNEFNRIIEAKINDVVKNPQSGFGFDPTVRNLFAVLLANAEVFIRLMGDVHERAFAAGNIRKQYITKEYEDETNGEPIYPWPEIKKQVNSSKDKVIAYPGEKDLWGPLRTNDPVLWPEVEFVEEFIGISTNIKDNLVEKEGGVNDLNYIFVNDLEEATINDVSTLFLVSDTQAYLNRTVTSFIYEIYERAKTLTLVDSYSIDALRSLVDSEFETIKDILANESDISNVLSSDQMNTVDKFKEMLLKVSPFERYEFYKESLPTTEYLKTLSVNSFKVEQYKNTLNLKKDYKSYENLSKFIRNYKPEEYRYNIYPFNSDLYLSYINIEKENIKNELDLDGAISLNQSQGYLTSTYSNLHWVLDDYAFFTKDVNLFSQKLKIDGNKSTSILNTPYFHKQLYSEHSKTINYAKYVGSSYLLLNSLPFFELSDIVPLKNSQDSTSRVRLSTLFKEIGSSHFLPYLMVIKWGAIYHRYKNFVSSGTDILNGFLTSNSNPTTTNINGELFFNNSETSSPFTGFTINNKTVTYSDGVDIGVHPYYDSIFHEVINGYTHYNVDQGNTSFSGKTSDESIVYHDSDYGNVRYWSGIVDNSKYENNNVFTLLPSSGKNQFSNRKNNIPTNLNEFPFISSNTDTFDQKIQSSYRILWDNEYLVSDFSGKTFSSPKEYNTSFDEDGLKEYSLSENYRKVIDLIGTFSPEILDEFETMFINFASQDLELEINAGAYRQVKYNSFQKVLREIVTIDKDFTYSNNGELFNILKDKQKEKLKVLSTDLLFHTEFVKITIGNPKELNAYVLETFYKNSELLYKTYNPSQLSNQKYLDLYIGENPDTSVNYYLEFFQTNNIELSEDNVYTLRPLVLIYAGYRKNGGANDSATFKEYIKTNIFDKNDPQSDQQSRIVGSNNRLEYFLNTLISKFPSLAKRDIPNDIMFVSGYNIDPLKIETYNFLKSFNDKWSAGNSIGQRLLMDEFLFLDKANVDIGDKVYLNIDRLISILSEKNEKANLYSSISMLIQNTGFDMRPLPAYINFYTSENNAGRVRFTPSKKTASDIFGTFLEVDYQETSPKIIIQFIGPSSKRPADLSSKDSKLADDSFYLGDTQNNPVLITLPEVFTEEMLQKSNKVVGFEVNVGDQYQGIFKDVSLDQSSIKNTSESFAVTENIARSESGSGTYNIDIALYEYYRTAAYTCEITCLGNVMIQPTMYFYLNNIPMFRGSYWITEVSHIISENSIKTKFKGARIPRANLPNPSDSFISSYRPLLDKVINNSLQIARTVPVNESTEKVIKTLNGQSAVINMGEISIPGESIVNTSALTEFGIPYNGYEDAQYIQKIKYKNNEEWYRTYVVLMDGEQYNIGPSVPMTIISSFRDTANAGAEPTIDWGMIENLSTTQDFYSSYFIFEKGITPDKLIGKRTLFLNPNPNQNDKKLTIPHNYALNNLQNIEISGPIHSGPPLSLKAGMGMSYSLMKKLNLSPNQVIYFKIVG
jgi:hypothetical protein